MRTKTFVIRGKKFGIAWLAAGATALIGAVVAFAFWSASGTGTGSALATTAQTVTVNAVALTNSAASLFPGGPPGNVYFTVTNPNPYPIKITNIAWGTPVSANPSACSSSVISVDSGAPTSGFNLTIAASGTSTVQQVNAVLDLSGNATDTCQGNAFNVPMTLTGVQLP
jgi:hypothetical protein